MRNSGKENPYISGSEGRKEWNDRYGSMRQSSRCWQRAFFCSMIINVIFALVIAKIATQSQIKPFIVETNRGMPYAIGSMRAASSADPRIINFAINQYIINARSLIHDTTAEKTLLNKVYAFSAGQAISFLRDYYQKNDPFRLSAQYTVTVQIINSLPISSHTWQVTWDETQYSSLDHHVLNVTRWIAQLTHQFGKVNPQFINDNPFGLYITHITWSQNQIGASHAN
ncbi:MAG: type IV secretion system protein [Candidatus Aquirickettsiella sp.]